MPNFQEGKGPLKGLEWVVLKNFTGRAELADGLTLAIVHAKSSKIIKNIRLSYGDIQGDVPQNELDKILKFVALALHEYDWTMPIDSLIKGPDSKAIAAAMEKLDRDTKDVSSKLKNKIHEQMDIDEDVAANASGSGNVAGYDSVGSVFKKKKKDDDLQEESDQFAGDKIFEVDSETFHRSIRGKKKFARYKKYMSLEDYENVGDDIRQYAKSNPRKNIILKDKTSGRMVYLKGKIHGDN